jgi:predicted esterase
LHGRYAPDAAADEVDRQTRLAARATARGFAVLALRGESGTCTAAELSEWFCWPSNPRNAYKAASFTLRWKTPLDQAQHRAGSDRRFLLGFSNGGYFAGLIALRGLLDVEAAVVAHAGPVEPLPEAGSGPPILLLSADDEISQDEMIRFDEELTVAGWPHDSYARAGGHALEDEDIDAALDFFSRAGESLPLRPPLALHRPVRRVGDGGAENIDAGGGTDALALSALSDEDDGAGSDAATTEGDDAEERDDAVAPATD